MPLDLKAGLIILLNTIIKTQRHEDYETVCEIAERYQIYATGKNIGALLHQFNPRESDVLFEQRKKLTKGITKDLVGACTKPMAKIGRAPVSKSITWKDKKKTEANLKTLDDAAKNFYGEQSVNDYLTYRMVELDTTDPNSFIVVEFQTSDGTNKADPKKKDQKLIPYPFEVSSKEAVNYIYKNNILQWLVVKHDIMIPTDKSDVEGEKYFMYMVNNSFQALEIHKSVIDEWKGANPNYTPYEDGMELKVDDIYLYESPGKQKKKYYAIQVFEHKMPFVPARRVGITRDLETRGRTTLPLIHQAEPYIEKSIKSMSEFDLTTNLHTFPQKLQYGDRCLGHQEKEVLIGCNRGMTPQGKICKACNGSGHKYHQSSQDMITLSMPKDPKDMISLEGVVVYKHPPIDLLTFMKTFNFYELRYFSQHAVYNSENFSKETIAKTATETVLDLDAVYDTLKPWATNYSGMWKFIYKCIASIINLYEGMDIEHVFPNDFKMKSLTMLLDDLKKATDNGAPSHIKKAIIRDITNKIYIDNPDEVIKINTKEKYSPFTGKTETEIQFIVADGGLVSKDDAVLYANFDKIFSDLEFEYSGKNIDFYKLEEDKQRKAIQDKVTEYKDKLSSEDKMSAQTAFNAAAGDALLSEAETKSATSKTDTLVEEEVAAA